MLASCTPIACWVVLLVGSPPSSLEEELGVRLERDLSRRDDSIEDLSARITYAVRARGVPGGPVADFTQAIEATWSGSVRGRVDLTEEPGVSFGLKTRVHVLLTSNASGSQSLSQIDPASAGRALRPGDGPAPVMARVLPSSGMLMWAVHPDVLLHMGDHSPLRALRNTSHTVTAEDREGRRVARVDWSMDSDNPPGSSLRGELILDPEKGFAVEQSETQRRPTPQHPFKPIARTECSDFVGFPDLGVWLPTRVKREEYTYFDDGNYEFKQAVTAGFSDWEINPRTDESTYELEIPDGAWVTDYVKGGGTYIKGQVENTRGRRGVAMARATAGGSGAMAPAPDWVDQAIEDSIGSRHGSALLWGLLLVLVVVAAAAGWIAYRLASRGKRIAEPGA